jgi:ADP-ribosylglycohydrolase/fructose-1,6-bisphosphatase/inositol monophosphatase family enzyme
MDDYAQALATAVEAAREAGGTLREEFHRPGGPRGGGGHADIDRPAEEAIRKRLLAALPWNYLGEETGRAAGDDRHYLWLVDPNDGTSAYLRGWRGSAVSIAALRDGVPILGVVHAFAHPDSGEGDLIAWAEGHPLTRNGKEIPPPPLGRATPEAPAGLPAVVFVSQDADRSPAANADCVRPARYVSLPSIAYRLARVAAGDGLAAVSLNRPGGWDYAAGHALLRASGGVFLDERGNEVRYAVDGQSFTRRCFGGAPAAVRDLCRRDWQKVFAASPAPGREGDRLVQLLAAAWQKVFAASPAPRPPFALVRPARGRAVADAGRLSRAQGCLLGQLAGDSLGGLVEFRDRGSIAQEYPRGVRDLRYGGAWHNLAGQPTDDSEMALMLARTLAHEGRYDRGAVLDAYCRWWPHAFDRGNTLRQALGPACSGRTAAERLRLAEQHAGRTSQSNGCLMRVSPLGVFGAGRPAEAAGWAREDAGLTHPHPVCQDACAVFVAAIATAVATGGTPQAAYEAALGEAGRSNVQAAVRQALEEARQVAPTDYTSQMGWVLIALQNAFWQLLHAASLEEGIVDTVMRGGDTDTNAAIAGAVQGRQAIPSRWLHALLSCRTLEGTPTRHPRPQEFWPVDALELAEAVLVAGASGGP